MESEVKPTDGTEEMGWRCDCGSFQTATGAAVRLEN